MLEDYFEQDDGNLDMWIVNCIKRRSSGRKYFFYLFYHCRLKRNFGDDSICLPPKKKNSILDQPACLETLTCIKF